MKKFEIGKTYSMRSICDHDCVWTYTVTARTAKTITISDGEKVQKAGSSRRLLNTETPKPFIHWASIQWPRH